MVSSRFSRRQVLGGLAALSLPLAGCRGRSTDRQTPTPLDDPPKGDTSMADLSVGLSTVDDGFVAPIGVEAPLRDGTYVVDQAGKIYILTEGGRYTFLDISDRIPDVSGNDERGLLGVTFHPHYRSNGRFFARYSAPSDDDMPPEYSHRTVLAEFQADPEETRADPATERRLLTVPQPQPNNNGSTIVFGPDGYLYVGIGDGGGAGDTGPGHVSDWYDPVEGGNGQEVESNLLGSVLRLDVDDEAEPYGTPDMNPLVDSVGLDEQFAWGFRNPRGLSFGPDGNLYVADGGEDRIEEVNLVESGGNYGWNVREGTHCFREQTCPRETADGDPLVPPVVEYQHEGGEVSGHSVVGGYIYEGSRLSSFEGLYVFADWQAEGQLFAARPTEEGLWETTTVQVVDDTEPYVLGFGRGYDDELYLCTNQRGVVGGSSGSVYRLEPA